MSDSKPQLNLKVHFPKEFEAYVVYEQELELLRNGGNSPMRGIMMNAFAVFFPFLINFLAAGGLEAFQSGNLTATLNLLAAAISLTAGIVAWIGCLGEVRKSDRVMRDILSRKDG